MLIENNIVSVDGEEKTAQLLMFYVKIKGIDVFQFTDLNQVLQRFKVNKRLRGYDL